MGLLTKEKEGSCHLNKGKGKWCCQEFSNAVVVIIVHWERGVERAYKTTLNEMAYIMFISPLFKRNSIFNTLTQNIHSKRHQRWPLIAALVELQFDCHPQKFVYAISMPASI